MISNNRDDFSSNTIKELSKRVGGLCSNPQCNTPTTGPHVNPQKSISKGEAAHISAASFGGKRYLKNITKKQRSSIKNGIWLCASCATLIDKDSSKYSIEILQRWKSLAEKRALSALENPRIINFGPNFSDSVIACFIQKETPTFGIKKKVTFRPINSKRDINDLKTPIIMDSSLKKDEVLLIITSQNQGSGKENDIKIKLSFDKQPVINEVEIQNTNRVQLIEGGNKTSSFVTFLIPSLLPEETQNVKIIISKYTIPKIDINSEKSNLIECFIFETIFEPK